MSPQADWSDRTKKVAFKKRYGTPFKGDGWYLLDADGQRSAQLSRLIDGEVETVGWFVSNKDAFNELARTEGKELRVREETW